MTINKLTTALLVAGSAILAVAAFAGTAEAAQATTLSKAALYAGPGGSFSQLGHLDGGIKVGLIWCGAEVKFCLVQYHNKQGWVSVDDLKAIGQVAPGTIAAAVFPSGPGALTGAGAAAGEQEKIKTANSAGHGPANGGGIGGIQTGVMTPSGPGPVLGH